MRLPQDGGSSGGSMQGKRRFHSMTATAQTPIATQPGQGTFDEPALRQDDKALASARSSNGGYWCPHRFAFSIKGLLILTKTNYRFYKYF
jgi:hypothetical protein